MQKIPEKIDSKFRFVLLASERAEQLMRGAQPKTEPPGGKITRVAMEEILDDQLAWEYGPPEEPPVDELEDGEDGEPADAEAVAEAPPAEKA